MRHTGVVPFKIINIMYKNMWHAIVIAIRFFLFLTVPIIWEIIYQIKHDHTIGSLGTVAKPKSLIEVHMSSFPWCSELMLHCYFCRLAVVLDSSVVRDFGFGGANSEEFMPMTNFHFFSLCAAAPTSAYLAPPIASTSSSFSFVATASGHLVWNFWRRAQPSSLSSL
jgi:hypothetical protein